MRRSDQPAIRDTAIWLGGMAVAGTAGGLLWGGWWAVPCFLVYGVMYGSAADSRWHEAGHGTAFRTQWLANAVYQLASFTMMHEPTVWRWSHTRHHTDTLIVGRDPEIQVMRPARLVTLLANFVGLVDVPVALRDMAVHASGRLRAEEATFVPESERAKVYRTARIWLLVYAAAIAACVVSGSLLPLMFIGGPRIYGTFMHVDCGTGVAGLADRGAAVAIELTTGDTVECDAVVVGIGAVPETALAEKAGLAVDNGVRVDSRLRTSDPDIFAAGDCCSFPHPLYGDRRIRLEAWRNAHEQADTLKALLRAHNAR